MKQKIVSLLIGLIFGLIGVSTIVAAPKLIEYSFSDMKVIYMGKELDLSGEKLLKVTTWAYPENEENIYVPVSAIMDSMGYYTTWDSFQNAVIVSRYEEDIKAVKLRDSIDSSYNGIPIKDASVDFLTKSLANSKWYYNSQKVYISYKFMHGNKFEYIRKEHSEKDFDVNTGTYTFENGAIVFDIEEEYKANEYGEPKTFSNVNTPEKIRVKINENDNNTIYIGFYADTQSFTPFIQEK